MNPKRSHSRSLPAGRVAWLALIFAWVAAFVILQGCGPAVPKEELGEILTEVPTEFYFERPYPVPWAIESGESDTEGDDSQLAEGVGDEKPADSNMNSAEAQPQQPNSAISPKQSPEVEGKASP